MTKTYEMVTITGREYFADGSFEDYTETFYANDKVGINNFVMFVDEVVTTCHFTKTEKVSVWAWLRG